MKSFFEPLVETASNHRPSVKSCCCVPIFGILITVLILLTIVYEIVQEGRQVLLASDYPYAPGCTELPLKGYPTFNFKICTSQNLSICLESCSDQPPLITYVPYQVYKLRLLFQRCFNSSCLDTSRYEIIPGHNPLCSYYLSDSQLPGISVCLNSTGFARKLIINQTYNIYRNDWEFASRALNYYS